MSSLIKPIKIFKLENETKLFSVFKSITIKNIGTWNGVMYTGTALHFAAETLIENPNRVTLELPVGEAITLGTRTMQSWKQLEVNATNTVAQIIIYE